MQTEIPVGAIIAMRRNGGVELWRVGEHQGEKTYGGIHRPLQPGETVYRAVWKGQFALESRGEYTLQPGDVEFVPTGFSDENGNAICTNHFVRQSPAWLRDAR